MYKINQAQNENDEALPQEDDSFELNLPLRSVTYEQYFMNVLWFVFFKKTLCFVQFSSL